MHNPASELMYLFNSWTSRKGQASSQVRVNSDEGWAEVSHGFHLLEEIEIALQDMSRRGRPVDVYLETLPEWRTSLMHYNRSWRQEPLQLRDPRLLAGLVALMESDPVAHLNEFDENDLRQKLEQFARALIDDQNIDSALRQYVLKLAAHIRFLLDSNRAGSDTDLSTCLAHLKFCFDAAATQAGNESARSSYKAAASWIKDKIIGPVAAGTILSLTQAQFAQLEG